MRKLFKKLMNPRKGQPDRQVKKRGSETGSEECKKIDFYFLGKLVFREIEFTFASAIAGRQVSNCLSSELRGI